MPFNQTLTIQGLAWAKILMGKLLNTQTILCSGENTKHGEVYSIFLIMYLISFVYDNRGLSVNDPSEIIWDVINWANLFAQTLVLSGLYILPKEFTKKDEIKNKITNQFL